jgi:spermidine/putrescine transport system ATP-binding protein
MKPYRAGEIVYISVRPEKTLFSETPVEGFNLRCSVRENIYIGTSIKSILLLPGGTEIRISSAPGTPIPPAGSLQYIHWKPEDAVLIASPSSHIFDAIAGVDLSRYLEAPDE